MTRPPAKPIGLKVEEAMTSAEIDIETVCPLKTPTFPPGTHEYDPKRHSLIEGVSKCMITREEAQAKFREYHDAQGPHDEVYSNHIGTELLSAHGSCTAQCRNLLWLNVLLAGNWRRRYWQPFHLPDHESPLGIERQRHLCPLLLGAKPLWHRGEWDSGPASKVDPWPWHRPTNDCPLCRFEATGQLLHSTGGPN